MNGGGGPWRRWVRVMSETRYDASRSAARWRSASSWEPMAIFSPSIRVSPTWNASPPDRRRTSAAIVQYSTAVKAWISRSRSTTRRTATLWTRPAVRPRRILLAHQRAELVAHQAVDDPPRLLRVDQVEVQDAWIGEGGLDGGLGDFAEGHPPHAVRRQAGVLGDVPRNRLALAIKVRGQPHRVGCAGGIGQALELVLAIGQWLVLRGEVVLEVDAQPALGQVPDVPIRGENVVPVTQVPLDRLGLGWRLDDHEVAARRPRCAIGRGV